MIMESSIDLVISSDSHRSPQCTSNENAKPLVKLTKKLTKLKSQEKLLADCGECDMFSSLRPRRGKKF